MKTVTDYFGSLVFDDRVMQACHIHSDWLLVWEQNDVQLKLLFLQTGTHSDLF